MINRHLTAIIIIAITSLCSLAKAEDASLGQFPKLDRDIDGIAAIKQGQLLIPESVRNKPIWIAFLADNAISLETSQRLQQTLSNMGYTITAKQEDAALRIEVLGNARIRNEEDNSFDTENVAIRDILPGNLAVNSFQQANPTPRPIDGGIANEANKAINQVGGSTGGGLAGIGVAIGVNVIRALFNSNSKDNAKPFQNMVGARSNRPLICFDACRRTHHEITLNILIPAQGNTGSQWLSITVDKLSNSVEVESMEKLANLAFNRMIEELSQSLLGKVTP